tara:strand:- start:159 stop:344 length:186 start_codon:yes stop_codon:yes gene_type:complete
MAASTELVKDLRKQFKFLGDMGAYLFLYVVGEDVLPHEEWAARRGIKPGPRSHRIVQPGLL